MVQLDWTKTGEVVREVVVVAEPVTVEVHESELHSEMVEVGGPPL